MVQALGMSGVESSETASVGSYEMGTGVGGISGGEDTFGRYHTSLSRSSNAQRLAAQDEGMDSLASWQRLLLTRTDAVPISEMIMQGACLVHRTVLSV